MMTRDELIAFETDIAEEFNAAHIPYPVHLANGNEDDLIKIFSNVGSDDWIFGSWRMHYHALLKGVPPETLKAAIMRGKSMNLSFPEHRVYGSAIVGGTIPIALGVAMSIARNRRNEFVWCFLGDMTSMTGIFNECLVYASNFSLPIRFIVEDNGISVCTNTVNVWGANRGGSLKERVIFYNYESQYPHCGAGARVQF